jgi:putative spermidine/putrescine transport system substrate-binding protein
MSNRFWAMTVAVVLTASACTGAGTPGASSTSGTSATTTASESAQSSSTTGGPAPTIGKGEGALNIIIWDGYAENGSKTPSGNNQLKAYDWVTGFEDKTGCKVNSKPGTSSDEMVTLMRQGGGTVWDGVSASGDATLRLISNGDVAAVDPALFPDFNDLAPFMQSPSHNTVNGKHYGVSHGWGGNLLMWRSDIVTTNPTSWDVVFDPDKSKPYQGKITAYNSPIYIADAALYLKAHRPELNITDPYELTRDQFDAAVALLKAQRPWIGKYWDSYPDEIDNFSTDSPTTVIGTTWPYQVNTLQSEGVKIGSTVPTEGMTGWADTWMMSSHAQHPNCMLQWMAWMITPQTQAQVAESFGEAPANPKACALLDKGDLGPYAVKDFCTLYRVNDKSFYDAIGFWKTPLADCGDSRGQTCVDYSEWSTKWTEIKG